MANRFSPVCITSIDGHTLHDLRSNYCGPQLRQRRLYEQSEQCVHFFRPQSGLTLDSQFRTRMNLAAMYWARRSSGIWVAPRLLGAKNASSDRRPSVQPTFFARAREHRPMLSRPSWQPRYADDRRMLLEIGRLKPVTHGKSVKERTHSSDLSHAPHFLFKSVTARFRSRFSFDDQHACRRTVTVVARISEIFIVPGVRVQRASAHHRTPWTGVRATAASGIGAAFVPRARWRAPASASPDCVQTR